MMMMVWWWWTRRRRWWWCCCCWWIVDWLMWLSRWIVWRGWRWWWHSIESELIRRRRRRRRRGVPTFIHSWDTLWEISIDSSSVNQHIIHLEICLLTLCVVWRGGRKEKWWDEGDEEWSGEMESKRRRRMTIIWRWIRWWLKKNEQISCGQIRWMHNIVICLSVYLEQHYI